MGTMACELKCARCGRTGHATRQCELPFYCTTTAADRRAEAAKKRAEWLARQPEKAKKQAEWLARQEKKAKKEAEFEARQAAREARRSGDRDCDTESTCMEVSTAAST